MRRLSFFAWLPIAGAACLAAATVVSLIDGRWLSAGLEAAGAVCFIASAVLVARQDRSS